MANQGLLLLDNEMFSTPLLAPMFPRVAALTLDHLDATLATMVWLLNLLWFLIPLSQSTLAKYGSTNLNTLAVEIGGYYLLLPKYPLESLLNS